MSLKLLKTLGLVVCWLALAGPTCAGSSSGETEDAGPLADAAPRELGAADAARDAAADAAPGHRRPTIMIISDLHTREPDHPDTLRLGELVGHLERGDHYPQVEMLVLTGDIVDTMWAEHQPQGADLAALAASSRLKIAIALLDGLSSIPYLPVIGNHEHYLAPNKGDPGTKEQVELVAAVWQKLTGRPTYYFVDRWGFRLVVLDSARGKRLGDERIDRAQVEWLASEALATSRPVLIFMHHPIRTEHELMWIPTVEPILAEESPAFFAQLEAHKQQIRAIFVGHGHLWVRDTIEGIPVYETPSMGKHFPSLDRFHLVHLDEQRGTITVEQGQQQPYIEPD